MGPHFLLLKGKPPIVPVRFQTLNARSCPPRPKNPWKHLDMMKFGNGCPPSAESQTASCGCNGVLLPPQPQLLLPADSFGMWVVAEENCLVFVSPLWQGHSNSLWCCVCSLIMFSSSFDILIIMSRHALKTRTQPTFYSDLVLNVT